MPLVAPIVSAPPVVPLPSQAPRFKRLSMTWTGWDGSVWPLTDPSSGAFVTDGGVRGLHMPPVQRYTSESPALSGSRWRANRTQERECFWPVYVYSDVSSEEWLERDRAFWRSLDPSRYGTWTVSTPEGQSRFLRCHLSESDDSFDRDPAAFGWHLYGVTLMAEQPYWTGAVHRRSFQNDPPVPFYGADHSPVPVDDLFFISSGSSTASATIDNPGDIDAWPVFVLDGPWDAGASVGIDGNVTTYGDSIPAGQSVVVDTRPDRLGAKQISTPTADPGSDAWMDALDAPGTDKFTSLTALALNVSVAAGDNVPLDVTVSGQGTLHVAVQPLYYRAW